VWPRSGLPRPHLQAKRPISLGGIGYNTKATALHIRAPGIGCDRRFTPRHPSSRKTVKSLQCPRNRPRERESIMAKKWKCKCSNCGYSFSSADGEEGGSSCSRVRYTCLCAGCNTSWQSGWTSDGSLPSHPSNGCTHNQAACRKEQCSGTIGCAYQG
jgi:hypothetical protein